MNAYTPRRCGARWLDGDCPRGVLAIMDHPNEPLDRYDVFYTETMNDGCDTWLSYLALSESGAMYHGEMRAHEVAAYRYRMRHRYTRWSTLPDAVKKAVRQDIAAAKEYADSEDAKR